MLQIFILLFPVPLYFFKFDRLSFSKFKIIGDICYRNTSDKPLTNLSPTGLDFYR